MIKYRISLILVWYICTLNVLCGVVDTVNGETIYMPHVEEIPPDLLEELLEHPHTTTRLSRLEDEEDVSLSHIIPEALDYENERLNEEYIHERNDDVDNGGILLAIPRQDYADDDDEDYDDHHSYGDSYEYKPREYAINNVINSDKLGNRRRDWDYGLNGYYPFHRYKNHPLEYYQHPYGHYHHAVLHKTYYGVKNKLAHHEAALNLLHW